MASLNHSGSAAPACMMRGRGWPTFTSGCSDPRQAPDMKWDIRGIKADTLIPPVPHEVAFTHQVGEVHGRAVGQAKPPQRHRDLRFLRATRIKADSDKKNRVAERVPLAIQDHLTVVGI